MIPGQALALHERQHEGYGRIQHAQHGDGDVGRVGGAQGGETCRNEDLEEETGVEQEGGRDVEGVGGAFGAAGAGVDAAIVGRAGGAAGVVRGGVDADGSSKDREGCWEVSVAGLEGRRGWERLAAEAGFDIRSWRHRGGADGRVGLLKRMKV